MDLNLARTCFEIMIDIASIVIIGLIPSEVGSTLPSAINKFLISKVSPSGLTTPLEGEFAIRHELHAVK